MKLPDENILDPVNSCPDVCRGKASDLAHGFRVKTFQISQNQLAVDEFKPLDQRQKARKRLLTVRRFLDVLRGLLSFDIFEREKDRRVPFLSGDVGCRHVMRNPIDPGSQRASRIEVFKTAPQRQMNFLQEVASAVGVRLIGPREALQGRAIFVRSLPPVLFLSGFCAHLFPTLELVDTRSGSLQIFADFVRPNGADAFSPLH